MNRPVATAVDHEGQPRAVDGQPRAGGMRAFAEAFFARFGAQVQAEEDELIVDLPPDLVETFGKPRLYLVFPETAEVTEQRELSPTEEILVYGSRVFDRMLALLADRGEIAHFSLPRRLPDGAEDPFAPHLDLPNSHLVKRQTWTDDTPFFLFHFRVIFTSDERQETIVSVLLTETGAERPDLLADLSGSAAFQPLEAPFLIEPGTLLRLYNLAGSLVARQAEATTADMERTIQTRLQKALLRLTTFYRRLSSEVNTGDVAKDEAVRAELQQELDRKIADELERHQLRVNIRPVSYAIALIPLAYFELTLATRRTEQSLEVAQSLYTGRRTPILCQHCAQAVEAVTICDHGHVAHPACLSTCHVCQLDLCHACDIAPCALCGQPICADCITPCAHCDRRICAEHVSPCAACGRPTCSGCMRRCVSCGMAQCPGRRCGQGEKHDGQCRTCQTAQRSEDVPESLGPVVAEIKLSRYRWQRAKNKRFTVYLGRSILYGGWVVVTSADGTLVSHRKVGFFRRLLRQWT